MPDPSNFEPRLADAFRRYSNQVPTDVDAMALAREIASGKTTESRQHPRWWPFGRTNREPERSRTMFIASGATAVLAVALVGSSLALLSVAPRDDEAAATAPAIVAPLNARVTQATTSSKGYQEGLPTDLLFDLGTSLDPSVPGRTLRAGASIRITLPEEFTSSGLPADVPSACDAAAAECNTGYLLQGWPQSYFPTSDYYTLEMDGTHTFVFTATQDLGPTAEAPGIKQIHLMAPGFTNPATTTELQVLLQAATGPDGEIESDTVSVVPSRSYGLAPTSWYAEPMQGAAFANTVHQQASVGGSPEWPWDFIIFADEEGPRGQVEMQPVAENSGTWVPEGPTILDSGEFKAELWSIGGWWLEGPEGATGATVTADPSVLVEAPISGEPATRLTVHFTAGDLPGRYTFHYGYGENEQMIVDVTE